MDTKKQQNSDAGLENIICITNRRLCPKIPAATQKHLLSKLPQKTAERLLQSLSPALTREFCALYIQLERLAKKHPKAIIVREKDLTPKEYALLLGLCQTLCRSFDIPLIAHSFVDAARQLDITKLHLSVGALLKLGGRPDHLSLLGVSVHSLDDAQKAVDLGADYLIAGHIFETECKAGLPGRGLHFLERLCRQSPIPIYAIGGITLERLPLIKKAGAAGGCMMSALMQPNLWDLH